MTTRHVQLYVDRRGANQATVLGCAQRQHSTAAWLLVFSSSAGSVDVPVLMTVGCLGAAWRLVLPAYS